MLILDLLKEYALIAKWQAESKQAVLPPRWNKGKKGNILLINGWRETWYFLYRIGDYLNKAGYRIMVPEKLGNNLMAITEGTKLVKGFIKDKECVIIAHSKGGLIGLNLINQSRQFKKLIAITAPFKGTIWSSVLPDKTLKELKIGRCPIQNNVGEKVICLYPKFDNHVIPNSHSLLEAAKNIQIDIVGHTRILNDQETWELIRREVEN